MKHTSPNEGKNMAALVVAFLYNVRHRYPDPADPASQLETDFDDPPTIEAMRAHLEACGWRVLPIEANEEAYLELHIEQGPRLVHPQKMPSRRKSQVLW